MVKVYTWADKYSNYTERMDRINNTASVWIRFPHLCELKLLPKE